MPESYYHIETLTMDASMPEAEWGAMYRAKYPCGHRNPPVALDVKIRYFGQDLALSFVDGVVFDYARLDLLEALGGAVEQFLTLGHVFDAAGRVVSKYRTIGSSTPLRIRGDGESTREFCPQCRTVQYFAMGDYYILKADLTGQPLYYPTQGGLVVDEALYSKLRGRKWKKLHFGVLPVLETPRDGLPADLNSIKPAASPHVVDLVLLVGWQGRPLGQVRPIVDRFARNHPEHVVDEATKELYEVDTDQDPPLVQLTEQGKKLALEILGPPPPSSSSLT